MLSVRSFGFLFVFALLLPCLWAAAGGGSKVQRIELPQRPFWQKKQRVYDRMIDQRTIYISVKTEEASPLDRLKILGAGVVFRPRGATFDKVIQFSQWEKIHPSIKKSEWSASTRRLFLHMEAYGYHAKMIFLVETLRKEDADWIYMNVVQGSFLGMRVALRFKDAKSRKAEVAMTARYDFEKLPMPQFLVEFGLEIVFQKIAEKMRHFVESES